MDKVNYTFLQKPTVAHWPSLPRQLKLALVSSIILVVVGIHIYRTPRSTRLEKILHAQTIMFEIFSSEMELMNRISSSKDDEWLPVDDLDGHVYSAYFDPRPEVIDRYSRSRLKNEITWAVVRIIAILPTNTDKKMVDCIYKYSSADKPDMIKRTRAMSVKPIEDNWNLKYSAFFVICDLDVPNNFDRNFIEPYKRLPSLVTISRYADETLEFNVETKFIDIRYSSQGMMSPYAMEEKFMAVCVPVLHHEFDRPLDVVEFVEYYRQLGANRFTFYNSSISTDVNRVLEYYVDRDAVTVLRWKLPAKYIFETTLRSEALFAAMNDCLYRNSFNDNYDYVGNFGIDDYLVPKMHQNFPELMEHLDPIVEVGNKHASFLFRSAFFYTMYQDDQDNRDPNVPYLYTQAKTRRVKELKEPGDMSRYVVRGRDVVELGNYRVSKLREGSYSYSGQFDELVVDPEVALSHHYSPCEAEETGCYLKPIVVDQTAHRFTRKLGLDVAQTCKNVFGNAGCPFHKKQTQM